MYSTIPLHLPLRPGVHSFFYFPSPNLAPSPLPVSPSGWIPIGDGYPLIQPPSISHPSRPAAPAPPFIRPRTWRRASQPAPSHRVPSQAQDARRMSLNPNAIRDDGPPPSQALYRPPYLRNRSTGLSPDAKPFTPRYARVKGNTRPSRSRPGYIDLHVNRVGPLDLGSPGSISSMSDGMPETPQGFLEIGRDPYQFGNPSVPVINEDYSTPPDAAFNDNVTPALMGRPIGVLPYSHSPRAPRRARQYRRQPAPLAQRMPLPTKEPSPGLFLHHDPPHGVPRHSSYRSDGFGGLEELPLPPMRTTPHGGINFLSWRMAYQWGLYSPDIDFSSDRGRNFWRKVGEDPGLPGPDPIRARPVRQPQMVPVQPRAKIPIPIVRSPPHKGRKTESVASNQVVPGSPPCTTESVSSLEVIDTDEELGKETGRSTPRPAYLPCAPPDPDVSVDSESSYVLDDVPELSDGSTMTDDSDDERAEPSRRRLPSSA